MAVQPASWVSMGSAAVSVFLVGGLWYSPALFGTRWQREVGLTDGQLRQGGGRTFATAAACALLAAINLGFFVGQGQGVAFGAFAGAATGLGFVAPGVVISYVFARRSVALMVIDAGYHAVAFTLAGVLVGALG